MQIIALVEDLAANVGMVLLQLPDLFVLLSHQLLVHRRDLDVEVVVGQVEVRGEEFHRLAVFKTDGKALGLILPGDAVEIQQKCELTLGVMSEVDFVSVWVLGGQGAPTSTTPASSSSADAERSSGNNW